MRDKSLVFLYIHLCYTVCLYIYNGRELDREGAMIMGYDHGSNHGKGHDHGNNDGA